MGMRTRTEKVKAYFDRLAQDYDARLPWDELTEHVYTELTWRISSFTFLTKGWLWTLGVGKWALPLADRGLRLIQGCSRQSGEKSRRRGSGAEICSRRVTSMP